MPKKAWFIALVIALAAVFLAAGLLIAADVPEEIVINDPVYEGNHKKGPVTFTHAKHSKEHGLKCEECHHKYEGDKNVWKEGDPVEKCSACHPVDKNDGKKLKMASGTVFHKQCRDCHKELKKGPYKKCDECHAEKS